MSTTAENKQTVRTFYSEVAAKGRTELLETMAQPDMIDHGGTAMGWREGRDGFVDHINWLQNAVSEIDITVDDLIGEDNRVVVYRTLRGVHVGDLFGVPGTGRKFTGTAISLFTFKDGKIAEYLVRPDALGILQELGAIPAPA
jgi:predicted ester cyclase